MPLVTVDESGQSLEYAAGPQALFVDCPRGPWEPWLKGCPTQVIYWSPLKKLRAKSNAPIK